MEEKSSKYLKADVYMITRTYVCALGLLLVGLNLGRTIIADGLTAITAPEWVVAGASGLIILAVTMISAIPGEWLKTVLVFWRWENPLPGSRAFQKANLDSDTRISVDRLRTLVGGSFPRGPKEQNQVWYRLYQSVKSDPAIAGLHFEYLLFRDLTWFTTVLVTLGVGSALINHDRWPELLTFSGVLIALDLLFMRAAAERGGRFARTVLAITSTK